MRRIRSKLGRRWVAAIAVVLTLATTACQAGPNLNAAPQDDIASALPPVPDAEQLAPLTGEALQKARTPLEQILADTPPPEYLPEDPQPLTPDEPPVDAQHAYVAGRQAWYERNTYQAINQLERALRHAPDQPAILRLLGEIYAEAGNRVRAAMYLRQAVELDPLDVPTLLQLGRLALEQRNTDEAIHLFDRALSLVRDDRAADAALQPLVHYHLAAALRSAGYAAAAIEQHARYRDTLPQGPLGHGAAAQHLMMLEHQAPQNWQRIGDLHHQLDAPDAAHRAYERAKELTEAHEQAPDHALIGRLIYTHLRLGDIDAAGRVAVDHIQRTDADEHALALVRYLTERGAVGEALADPLRAAYEREGRPASLALALADLLDGETGRSLLRDHLEAHPHDARVFEGLVRRLLKDAPPADESARVRGAMRLTADAMAAAPDQADARAAALFDAVGGAAALLESFATLDAEQREQTMMRVLHGLALMAAGRVAEAAGPLADALEDDPELEAARLALAQMAIRHGDHARAGELLAPLAERGEPEIVRLHVRVLERRGALDEALELLERHLAHDASVELLLQKAALQLRAGDAQTAERTLLDALNAHPEDERIYAALLDMYDPGDGEMPAVDDAQVQYQRLVRRLLGTIPDSRLGKLVRANLMSARGEYADAERLLKSMIEQLPLDLEVVEELLRIYLRSNQPDAASELIRQMLEAHPHQHELLMLAVRFYREIEDLDGALAIGDRLLALEPTDIELVSVLVSLFIWIERPDKAVEAVEQALAADVVAQPVELASLLARAMRHDGRAQAAIERLAELAERFPDHEADIHCELALLLDGLGEPQRAEQVLIDTLERHPDHPRANNALGYTWADRDTNLERAKRMIRIAVEAEPDSAAYLDSLGWVYYKLGDFEAAVEWLERSHAADGGNHPVILDHLGDAYHRLDERGQAQRYWTRALMRLRQIASPEHYAELDGLEGRLRAKLQALEAGEGPAVAHSPGADAADDAD